MLPTLHYQGLNSPQPFGYTPPISRSDALAAANSAIQAGMVRNADQMEGTEEVPPAKRQRIAKLPGGALYPEDDWIGMHPVRVSLAFLFFFPS